MLLFRAGAFGATPQDFPEEVAKQFDMTYVSADRIQASRYSNNIRHSVGRTIIRRGKKHLQAGNDLMVDAFYNTPATRGKVPIELARSTGALCVALYAIAPEEIIRSRVASWVNNRQLRLPLRKWEVDPRRMVGHMLSSTVPPSQQEPGLDFVFELDGRADTAGLLDQVERQFKAHSLIS